MSRDDEEIVAECPNCGQALREKDSYCRKCGEDVSDLTSDDSMCFIATAAYGTPFAEEINVLRRFRDNTLQQSSFGRSFIDFYYLSSPPIARFISSRPHLRKFVRSILNPLVTFLKKNARA
jgi:hypothetical protein